MKKKEEELSAEELKKKALTEFILQTPGDQKTIILAIRAVVECL